LRKTTDRTGESLRVAGKSVANAPRPAVPRRRSARKTHVFPATAARSSGKPQHPGRMPGPTRPKPPPVKAALLGIPKNVIFARVIL